MGRVKIKTQDWSDFFLQKNRIFQSMSRPRSCLQVNKKFNKELTEKDSILKRIMKKIENEDPSILSREEKDHLKLQFNERFHSILHPYPSEVSEQTEDPKQFKKLEKECDLILSVSRQAFYRNTSGEDPFIREYQKNNPEFFDALIQTRDALRQAKLEAEQDMDESFEIIPSPDEIPIEEFFEINPSLKENTEFIKSAIKNDSLEILSEIDFATMNEEQFIEILSSSIKQNIDESVSEACNVIINNMTASIQGQDVDLSLEGELVTSNKFLRLSLITMLGRRLENPEDTVNFLNTHREKILGKLEEGKKEQFEQFIAFLEEMQELQQIQNAMQNEEEE